MALSLLSGGVSAGTYINPMDVEYQYAEVIEQRMAYPGVAGLNARMGADPVMVHLDAEGEQRGYYLFGTHNRGYYYSADMVSWEHIVPQGDWPVSYFNEKSERERNSGGIRTEADTGYIYKDMIAPAAAVKDGQIYLMASSRGGKPELFVSEDARSGQWRMLEQDLGFPNVGDKHLWDPALYHEGDQWYIFWGSSHLHPLYGAKLNETQKNGIKVDRFLRSFVHLYPDQHGWERMGWDHRAEERRPYGEGPELIKDGDTYYLTYAAPGTDNNVYGDGVYTAKSPLGPFVYQEHNPVSYKPGGYVHGAGHGNTFRDEHGNVWRSGTSWLGVNWVFERRLVMLPGAIDADGQLYSTSRFADFPQYAPTGEYQDPTELFTGWMLLSYQKPVSASSEVEGHEAARLSDEEPRSYWLAQSNGDEHIVMDLQGEKTVRAIQLNYTDHLVDAEKLTPLMPRESDLKDYKARVYSHYRVSLSSDGEEWTVVADNSAIQENRANPYIQLDEPVEARFVKFENLHVPTEHLALSAIRVFGNAPGKAPKTPKGLKVERQGDRRNAVVSWTPQSDAKQGSGQETVGYNIRFGHAKDKLYHTYQIWHDEFVGELEGKKEIRSLNLHSGYCFAIEAFNETGVSKLGKVRCAD
ncbi:family 43 glycosylhydrolase [Ferrimonas pelagia]|uniref:Family 43 glycosylhydrolase n=1 Tax=Ferrimonas pelagia TaxID=1177826 RepID=A0ABP9EC84_9GAMM